MSPAERIDTCNACGGVLGRDCFNPQECEWITRDMERRQLADSEPPVPAERIDFVKLALSGADLLPQLDDEFTALATRLSALREAVNGCGRRARRGFCGFRGKRCDECDTKYQHAHDALIYQPPTQATDQPEMMGIPVVVDPSIPVGEIHVKTLPPQEPRDNG